MKMNKTTKSHTHTHYHVPMTFHVRVAIHVEWFTYNFVAHTFSFSPVHFFDIANGTHTEAHIHVNPV